VAAQTRKLFWQVIAIRANAASVTRCTARHESDRTTHCHTP